MNAETISPAAPAAEKPAANVETAKPAAAPAAKPVAKPAAKMAAKTARKPSAPRPLVAAPEKPVAKRPAARTRTRPAAKAAAPVAAAKKPAPAKKAEVVKKAAASAKKASDRTKKAAPAKPGKVKKPKLVRDSFTMPENEYAVIAALKKRCVAAGVPAKKSEILRAAIANLAKLSDSGLLATIKRLEVIKTGRPKGSK
jgi:hypothetical protein